MIAIRKSARRVLLTDLVLSSGVIVAKKNSARFARIRNIDVKDANLLYAMSKFFVYNICLSIIIPCLLHKSYNKSFTSCSEYSKCATCGVLFCKQCVELYEVCNDCDAQVCDACSSHTCPDFDYIRLCGDCSVSACKECRISVKCEFCCEYTCCGTRIFCDHCEASVCPDKCYSSHEQEYHP